MHQRMYLQPHQTTNNFLSVIWVPRAMPSFVLAIWNMPMLLALFVNTSATDAPAHFGIPWQQRQQDKDGRQEALLHPSCLHVARSCIRFGGVSWREVKQKAFKAEEQPESFRSLYAEAVFEHLGGIQSTPDRLLCDEASLSTAYAALLTNQMIRLRWREVNNTSTTQRSSDAEAGLDVYCSRRHEAAGYPEPSSVFLAKRPVGLGSKRFLALADPRLLSPWRRKLKPRWQKVWDYSKKMVKGEQFPPVLIAWRKELEEWTWRDGCHRYFASLVSGQFLRVSFKDPQDQSVDNGWQEEMLNTKHWTSNDCLVSAANCMQCAFNNIVLTVFAVPAKVCWRIFLAWRLETFKMEQHDDIPLLKTCLFRILCLRDSQMNLFWRSNLDCSESPSHIRRFLHDYCGNQAGRNAGRKRWSFPYLPDARLPEVADRLTSFTPDYIVSKFMYKGGSQAVPCHIAIIASPPMTPMRRPGGVPKKQQKSVQLWSSMGFS